MTKFTFALRMPASTFWRSAIFSRTRSRNWRISSSRLSFSSLCPRVAVASFFFSLVSSIRVGLTCVDAMRTTSLLQSLCHDRSASSRSRVMTRHFRFQAHPPCTGIFTLSHNTDPDTSHRYVSARFSAGWKAVSSQSAASPQYRGPYCSPGKHILFKGVRKFCID